jgi:type IV pilus assembly protein PilN
MIRINLLGGPRARTDKGQWDVRMELAGGVAVMVLALVGCLYYSGVLDDEIGARQLEKEQKQKQLAVLQEKLKQVEDFERKKKLLEDKNLVIEQLEKSRAGPVKVLDHVSQSLEPLKLWLNRLSVKGNDVELEGRALTNDDVVEFVNNLRNTQYFTNIRLVETRAGTESKLNVYQFKVNLSLKI